MITYQRIAKAALKEDTHRVYVLYVEAMREIAMLYIGGYTQLRLLYEKYIWRNL